MSNFLHLSQQWPCCVTILGKRTDDLDSHEGDACQLKIPPFLREQQPLREPRIRSHRSTVASAPASQLCGNWEIVLEIDIRTRLLAAKTICKLERADVLRRVRYAFSLEVLLLPQRARASLEVLGHDRSFHRARDAFNLTY